MGMESYFLNIHISYSIDINELLSDIYNDFSIKKYNKISNKKTFDGKTFILNDCVVLTINQNENYICICLEACYANYDRSLKIMYELYNMLLNKYENIYLSYGLITTNHYLTDYDLFKNWVNNCNPQKREVFMKKYGQFSKNILPNDFYNFIRKHKN